MNDIQAKAVEMIEAQQKKVPEWSARWMVGEQLKDICRHEPRSAELIVQDLQVKEMGIVEAEKKIKALADSRKKGNSSCVAPMEADRILREFYGLPAAGEPVPAPAAERPGGKLVRLEDFF